MYSDPVNTNFEKLKSLFFVFTSDFQEILLLHPVHILTMYIGTYFALFFFLFSVLFRTVLLCNLITILRVTQLVKKPPQPINLCRPFPVDFSRPFS